MVRGKKEPMTPQRALVIASLVCRFELETTTTPEWKRELDEVVTLLEQMKDRI